MGFSTLERISILAFYYFDKAKHLSTFSKQFNQYFNRNLSPQTLLYEVSSVKNIDPANNTGAESSNKYYEIWKFYITENRLENLKSYYKSFKHGDYIKKENNLQDADEHIIFRKVTKVSPLDIPEDVPEDYNKGIKAYKRHKEIVLNAIALANYSCEGECNTPIFVRKDGVTNYTEAHHIIPLCYQGDFKYSLDVEANVVSLCPRCHRLLHYGADYEQLLKKLYISRGKRLEKCGIGIGFEQLLLLYR